MPCNLTPRHTPRRYSQLSPFKIGAIQQLIADGDADLGKKTAPYFAIILVLFLLAFLGYFVTALVALVVCRMQIDSKFAPGCAPVITVSHFLAHLRILLPL